MLISDQPPAQRQCGLTLLEVMVVVATLSIILVAAGSIFLQSGNLMALAAGRDNAMEQTRQACDEFERSLVQARLLALDIADDTLPNLVYVQPVDVGEDANGNGALDAGEDENGNGALDTTDGDVTNAEGVTEWGCLEADGPRLDTAGSPHRMTIAFEQQGTVTEVGLGVDLNGDGDENDNFITGSLVWTTSDGRRLEYGANTLVLADEPYNADRDGDGVADPLFSVFGEEFPALTATGTVTDFANFTDSNANEVWDGSIQIHLSALWQPRGGDPQLIHTFRQVSPRNQSQ